jgi:hypothetical protein
MITTRNLLRASAVVLAVLVVGCTTPEARIKENPGAFARLTPGQQALVKAGHIAPGFDMDAVRLALGEPDRIVTVTRADGQRQVWHYAEYGDDDGRVVFDGFYNGYNLTGGPIPWEDQRNYVGYPSYRGYGKGGGPYNWGGPYLWSGAFIYDTTPEWSRDRLRVIFDTTGHVAAIHQAKT